MIRALIWTAALATAGLLAASCVDTAPSANTDAAAPIVATSLPPAPDIDALAGPPACTDPPASGGLPEAGTAGGPYSWQNVQILGGGFVTGIVFSPVAQNVIYARTDVGGAYRWDAASSRWVAMTDWVGRTQSNLEGIESVAADPVDPSTVYLAAGEYLTSGNGFILRSVDLGATWTQNPIAVPMGGNANGRSMGERLAIDPNLTSTLYFASRSSGLWSSVDSATTWNQVTSFPVTGDATYGLSFVVFDPSSGASGNASSTIYVGVATTAGPSLYRTTDGGTTWQAVPGQPTGLFPHHGAMDATTKVLYLAYDNSYGPNNVTSGAVWKIDTTTDTWTNITPAAGVPSAADTFGYGGLSLDTAHSGTLMVTTIDRWGHGDDIYRTTNAGAAWTDVGAHALHLLAGATWLDFGGGAPTDTGWMGSIAIDPFNPARALYVTGQGLWWSNDVTDADSNLVTSWTFADIGIEQTVALGLISPSFGAHLISALGDLCGFKHDNLDMSPPGGMMNDPIFGNTTSLDFAEQHPSIVVRVGTNSAFIGHGAYSIDGGATWVAFPTEPRATTADGGAAAVSAGSIAVSSDGSTLLWAPTGTRQAPATASYSTDWGVTWKPSAGLPNNASVASDRVNPAKFYARSTGASLYVSTDGGATFTASPATGLPTGGLVRPTPGIEGDLWLANAKGLYHSTDAGTTFVQDADVQAAYALGFGRGATCQSASVLYLAGTVAGTTGSVTGVFRSDDTANSWQRIDDAQHQFGSINYLTGDPRTYGRVYLGSGGRGILYGDPL